MLPQPASAAATDPTLTKLKNAADAARVFGFQDLRNQAEGKLAQGLRFVTDRALATALAAPAGSAAEGVAKQQAREVIQQGQVWVTTIVPGVARVDPSLPGYLVDALERLNGSGPFEVVVLANTTVNSYSAVWLSGYHNCSSTLSGPTEALAADTPVPATLAAQDGFGASVQATVTRPSPNALAFDVTLVADSGAPCQYVGSRVQAGAMFWTRRSIVQGRCESTFDLGHGGLYSVQRRVCRHHL